MTESWAWDKRSDLTSTTDTNGRTTGYSWDKTGNMTGIGYPGPAGALDVARTFDDTGRLIKVKDWADRETSFGFDGNDNWTSTGFGGGTNTDSFGFDQANRMTSASWKQNSTVLGSEAYTNRPTAKGMVKTLTPTGTAGTGAKTATYDSRDRLTALSTDTYTVDAASNVTGTADGRTQVFDPAQRLCWSVTGSSSASCAAPPADATVFGYDALGNRTSETPAHSAPKTFAYDQADRLASATVPSAAGGDGQFVSFAAERLVDTSDGTGACVPGPCARLSANSTKTVTLAGQGSVPTTGVGAVWVTVTVTNPGADGYVQVNPANGSAATTLSFQSGQDRSETAIVPLVNGKLTVTSSAAADVVLDVSGYFQASGSASDTYQVSPPTRVADTRDGTGTCDGAPCGPLVADHTTLVQVAGLGDLPASGVHAAVVTVSVLDAAGPAKVLVAPDGAGTAAAATIDVTGGFGNETVIAPLDASGRVAIRSDVAVSAVIDVAGYFTVPAGTDLGLAYEPLAAASNLVTSATGTGPCAGAPCGALVAAQRQNVQVTGQAGIPSSASAVIGTLTLTNPGADGYVQINPTGTTGLGDSGDETITMHAGVTRNSVVMVPLTADGTIEIGSTTAAGWTLDVSGYLTQPTATWTYHYDSGGLRNAKTAPDTSNTTFTWDRASGLPQLIGQHTGTQNTWILYGPGGQPFEQINTDGTAVWLHPDQLGSVRVTTSSTTGAAVSTRSFDPYGNTKTATGTQPLLGYAAQYTDQETGYQYLRARYYDPTTTQFLTQDPLVALTGEPYGYTGANPLNGFDPSGASTCGLWAHSLSDAAGKLVDCATKGGKKAAEETKQAAVAVANTPATAAGYGAAKSTGGDCRLEVGDWTVRCYNSSLPPGTREGGRSITIGNIIITEQSRSDFESDPSLIHHEYRHSQQWALFGPLLFPLFYGEESLHSMFLTGDPACLNAFEVDAGLEAGGYACGC